MARVFAGDSDKVNKDVLKAAQQLPDGFWVFAEFDGAGRNVDWLVIREVSPDELNLPSTLILTELKESAKPLSGAIDGPWQRLNDQGEWDEIPPKEREANHYRQAVNAANEVNRWLYGNQTRYREGSRYSGLNQFNAWPVLLILSPPGVRHQLPLESPRGYGRLFFGGDGKDPLETWLHHVQSWHQKSGVGFTALELQNMVKVLGLQEIAPPPDLGAGDKDEKSNGEVPGSAAAQPGSAHEMQPEPVGVQPPSQKGVGAVQLPGLGFSRVAHQISHACLLLDGSASMAVGRDRQPALEKRSGKLKHRAVAEMVQDVIRILHDDDAIEDIWLTVICYDGTKVDDIRLSDYDAKKSKLQYRAPLDQMTPYPKEALDLWDPVKGHGGNTPIGNALKVARELAEGWVKKAPAGTYHRAVICLLSDGMNNNGPDGMEERAKLEAFNEEQKRKSGTVDRFGRIRLATVGYFQYLDIDDDGAVEKVAQAQPDNEDVAEEVAGRALLKALASPSRAYFQSGDASTIARFLRQTIVAS
jgi:hypothetical protein